MALSRLPGRKARPFRLLDAIFELIPANTKPRVIWDESAMVEMGKAQIKQAKPKETILQGKRGCTGNKRQGRTVQCVEEAHFRRMEVEVTM